MRLVLLLLCTTLLGACSCQKQPQPGARAAAVDSAAAGGASTAGGRTEVAEAARVERMEHARSRALSEAVDTLHAYLRELGSDQRDAADRRWAYQRAPSVDEEAGLRALHDLQALRIENDTPIQLDKDVVPAYVEIPVRLRATLDGGEGLRYRGWYRLRFNPVTTGWELTAASVSPVIR